MYVKITVDGAPPLVTNCPQNIRENLGVGPRKDVYWTEPTGRDSSGNTVIPTQTHRPGIMFDLGPTTVEYTFTANGRSVQCLFTVTIIGEFVLLPGTLFFVFENRQWLRRLGTKR